jgi:hypothetical protein
MQLQNLLQHKKDSQILVNGHIYKIAHDLVIRDDAGNAVDVPKEDAERLLANRDAWRPVGVPKTPREVQKGTMKLITATGDLIEAPKPVEVEKPAVVAPVTAPIVETKPQEDPPIPGKGEDWADPDAMYSMKWLLACAKAYKIKKPGKDKAVLVEQIKAAMYE